MLEQQDAINRRIAKRVPVMAQKSTQEEPQKPKRTGFRRYLRQEREAETDRHHYTLNRDMIAWQQE